MHPARIAELLRPFLSGPCHSDGSRSDSNGGVEACPERSRREPDVLSPVQLNHISTYIDILLRWNDRINLTAIRNEEEIVTRHFGESFFAASHLFPVSPSVPPVSPVVKDFGSAGARSEKLEASLADLGSGAGFPGLPIKLWAPNISLTLIESNQKKATFLREVTRSLTLTNVNIQNARAETLTPATFDIVTLRAVERFADILPIAARLLAPSGRLALLIASSQIDVARSAVPNVSFDVAVPIPESSSRLLLVGHMQPIR